jgi:hypothetical protein
MATGVRNRHYRNVATGEIVRAERLLPHSHGAEIGTGVWQVRGADGKDTQVSHADFAAAHVPAE